MATHEMDPDLQGILLAYFTRWNCFVLSLWLWFGRNIGLTECHWHHWCYFNFLALHQQNGLTLCVEGLVMEDGSAFQGMPLHSGY